MLGLCNSNVSLEVKTGLYEAIAMSTLLYSAEVSNIYLVWPLTATLTKRLDADRITPQMAGAYWTSHFLGRQDNKRGGHTRTGQQTMDNILRERRLRCLGHVFRMDHQRIPQQASTVLAGTRIQERTRSTKSELEEHSQQRPTKDWVHHSPGRKQRWQTWMASECVAHCVQLDAG